MKSLSLLARVRFTLWILQTVFSKPLTAPCDPLCEAIGFHDTGICQIDGRCLCWWGWTGPNAVYINEGVYTNRILADHCTARCRYNHAAQNPECAKTAATNKTVSETNQTTTSVTNNISS